MTQEATVHLTKTVTVNGNASTCVIASNCEPAQIPATTLRLLEAMKP